MAAEFDRRSPRTPLRRRRMRVNSHGDCQAGAGAGERQHVADANGGMRRFSAGTSSDEAAKNVRRDPFVSPIAEFASTARGLQPPRNPEPQLSHMSPVDVCRR